jgi:hypothetical protein
MSVGLRRLIIIILGVLAGVSAWPLLELVLTFQTLFPGYFLFSISQGALFGFVLGLFFGSAEGLTSRNRSKIVRGMATGAAVGIVGGMLGFTAGQGVLFFMLQQTVRDFAVPAARGVGWAVLGLMVGMVEGIRAKSAKKCGLGALGGVLGGLLGGAVIEFLRSRYPDLIYARLAGFALFGLLIALFYALLERSFSYGVLRLLNGALRGKEYSLSQNRLSMGSGPGNDIVLAGYNDIAPRHALFRVKGREVYVEKAAESVRLLVNEEAVKGERLLKFEDVIQLGSAKAFFKTE